MAAVAVTAENLRRAEANITNDTGTWGNDGGGGGVSDEPDFYYQGGAGALTSQSRKISTSVIGRSYDHGSGQDLTATDRRHSILKIQATNKDALLARSAPALHLKIGSSSSNYDTFYLFGNDNYPKRGGWQIIAVSANVSGYRDATTATAPTRTSQQYWSLLADFSATSKSENVMIDAIDIGAGLYLVGGDGVDADGVFQDFIDFDEGTLANSYGYVATEGPILLVNGRLEIGANSGGSTATVFNDSDKTVIWQNGYVETGFHEFLIDLGNATTDVDLTRCILQSIGQENNDADRGYTTTEDSRAVFTITGTSGAFDMAEGSIINFSSVALNDSCSLDGVSIIKSGQIDATNSGTGTTGASLNNSKVLEAAVDANTSAVLWNLNADPDGNLDNMTFSKGATAHHAIEFGANIPSSITLRNCDFTGFNATQDQNDSTFHFKDTTGTITLNLIGCTSDVSLANSYRTDGATINVVEDPVTVLVNVKDNEGANEQNARVYFRASSGTGDIPFEASVTSISRSGTVATVTMGAAHNMNSNEYIKLAGITDKTEDNNGAHQITVTGATTFTYVTTDSGSTSYTGTIIATGVLLHGLTDASGNISYSRTLTNDQPMTGFVRKSTSSPRFKTFPISGTIDNANGLTINVQLILDE